jgi:hypothetical protein
MPCTLESQGELFPRLSAESLESYLERARRRIHRLAARLTPEECARVLGELALLESFLDRVESWHELRDRFTLTPQARPAMTAPRWALNAADRLTAPPAWAMRRDARREVPRVACRAHGEWEGAGR